MTPLRSWQHLSLCLCLLSLLAATGCDVRMGNWSQARYERTAERQTALPPGGALDVDTSSGSVTITGTETTECHVVAAITARAPSDEEAQELGEQVEIRLEQAGDTLKVRADKPKLKNHCSISVSYTITAPRRTNVQCHSSYGSLHLADLEGTIDGTSGSGSVTIDCTATCPADLIAEVTSSYGSIHFTAPPAFAGQVHLATRYGSVRTERPITISGSITKKKIAGTIGAGALRLETGNGSIELR